LKKAGFLDPFRRKRLSYYQITLMLFRTLPVAPGCNKVLVNEKTSDKRYKPYFNRLDPGARDSLDHAPGTMDCSGRIPEFGSMTCRRESHVRSSCVAKRGSREFGEFHLLPWLPLI
jgi:hypothetical protein